MVSSSELPGSGRRLGVVAAGDLLVQVDRPVRLADLERARAVDAPQHVVVARLQPAQAGQVACR